MNKEGKNFKIFGFRQSLIGDSIMALPLLNYFEKIYPNSYKYWHLAKKCSQASSLFLNHPLIDKILISDCEEGFGPKDLEICKTCDIVINTTPLHPYEQDWHNYRNMYEETWVMAGLPLEEYYKLSAEEQKPKLYKWFDTNRRKKTIAIHCFAGYGRDNHRSPSGIYWEHLISKLIQSGYDIFRLGHPNDRPLSGQINYISHPKNYVFKNLCNLSFIEQIQIALECNLYIGTDSGFSLIMGAYNEIPQLTLLTNWNIGHKQNFNCLSPNNEKNITLFAEKNCDNIPQELILEKIKNVL